MSAFTETQAPYAAHQQPSASPISAKRLWTGRVLSGLASAFLLFDGGAKLLKATPVIDAMTRLGYPQSTIVGIGTVLLACTILYVIPRTAVLGAVLLSAYLGGAVATNLRVGGPVFPIVFPILFGFVLWAGLYLRDARLRLMIS
ncbi:DoxX family protein [soil metagenome]